MSYELSFSPEFFLAPGEPFDTDKLALNAEGKPVSVWSAIQYWHDHNADEWVRMAKELFGLKRLRDAHLVMCEGVYEKIRETNTCTNIDADRPIEVWIDPEGEFRIKVWSGEVVS